MRRRTPSIAAALVGLLTLPACGGGSGGGASMPTAPTAPPTPSQASITVTCGDAILAFSPNPSFNFRVVFPCTLRESAGLGANINFVRASFTIGGVEVERSEIGAADIALVAGSNRLAAGSTLGGDFAFDFNRDDVEGGTVTFDFTDDRSNAGSVTFSF